MARLTDYRLLDQVSLALERGMTSALDRVHENPPCALGPIIETSILTRTNPIINPFLHRFDSHKVIDTLDEAQKQSLIACYGKNRKNQWGFMCLKETSAEDLREPLYAFQLAARNAMRFRQRVDHAKAKICGALQEMVDNILDHSEAPRTGLIGFLRTSDHFELSIGDAGRGVLESLQTNPTFSYLQDSGTAMSTALMDGNSRYGPALDRGYGFGTLFRALNSLDAQLRFRSGDYALEIAEHSPSLGNAHVSQKATLQGFVVSLKLLL